MKKHFESLFFLGMYLACADYAGASTYIVSKETMKKCLFNPDSNLSFKECCLKNAPVSPSDLDYGNYTHSEDKKWCNAIGAIHTSGSIPKCECKIKINSTTTKQFSWDSMGTCSVKTSTTNDDITQNKEFFEECLRTLLNEHFFNNMITPLTTLSNVTKSNCTAISGSGGGTGGSGDGTDGDSGGTGGGSGGGTGGENPTPPENPPTPPAPPTLTPEQECTAAGKIWDATNEKCMTQEEQACGQQLGTWSTSDNTCVGTNGTGWYSVWNHDTMKFDCVNIIEYTRAKGANGEMTPAEVQQVWDVYYWIVYNNAQTLQTNPNYTDLKWTLTGRNAPKCMSKIERQCNEAGGLFDYGDNKTGKCYNHNDDKTWCEKIGAKYKDEGGYYTCNCKIAGQDKRILWLYDPRGNAPEYICRYHKGNNNWDTYYGVDSQFFESCLRNHIDPAFNIIIKGTSFFVIKKLNCE